MAGGRMRNPSNITALNQKYDLTSAQLFGGRTAYLKVWQFLRLLEAYGRRRFIVVHGVLDYGFEALIDSWC
jgi:hypothetical protein